MASDNSSGASFSNIAQAMRDEGEHQLVDGVRPLRVSGFISLICGLLSGLCFLGLAMLLFPMISLVTGFAALRRYDGPAPVGMTVARIGMVLAVAFGSAGFATSHFYHGGLKSQAEKFTRDYLSTIAQGQPEVAIELGRPIGSRSSAPLVALYQSEQSMMQTYQEFVGGGLYEKVSKLDNDVQWRVSRPTKVDVGYDGEEQYEVVMMDEDGKLDVECQVFLKYVRDRQGNYQWYVFHSQPYRELIIAKGLN